MCDWLGGSASGHRRRNVSGGGELRLQWNWSFFFGGKGRQWGWQTGPGRRERLRQLWQLCLHSWLGSSVAEQRGYLLRGFELQFRRIFGGVGRSGRSKRGRQTGLSIG